MEETETEWNDFRVWPNEKKNPTVDMNSKALTEKNSIANGWRRAGNKKSSTNVYVVKANGSGDKISLTLNCQLKFKEETLSWWILLLFTSLFVASLSITDSIFFTRMTYMTFSHRLKLCVSHTQRARLLSSSPRSIRFSVTITFLDFNKLRFKTKFDAVIESE